MCVCVCVCFVTCLVFELCFMCVCFCLFYVYSIFYVHARHRSPPLHMTQNSANPLEMQTRACTLQACRKIGRSLLTSTSKIYTSGEASYIATIYNSFTHLTTFAHCSRGFSPNPIFLWTRTPQPGLTRHTFLIVSVYIVISP